MVIVKGVRWCYCSRWIPNRGACMILVTLFLICYTVQMGWIRRQKSPHNSFYRAYNRTSSNSVLRPPPNLRLAVRPEKRTTLVEPPACGPDTFLAVIVCSAAENEDARLAIRNTWGGQAAAMEGVRLLFLLGRSNVSEWQIKVEDEGRNYSDIIQDDFLDTYDNLTLKTVILLKWVNRTCAGARYVMKSDDDMFLNVPNLVKRLDEMGRPSRLLLGSLFSGAVPLRQPGTKWFSPGTFGESTFPDYLSGTGYVMSGDVVGALYSVALSTPFFRLEDVFLTGLCAKRLGLEHRNDPCFHYHSVPADPCYYRRIVSAHRVSPDHLRQMWLAMHDEFLECENAFHGFILRSLSWWYC